MTGSGDEHVDNRGRGEGRVGGDKNRHKSKSRGEALDSSNEQVNSRIQELEQQANTRFSELEEKVHSMEATISELTERLEESLMSQTRLHDEVTLCRSAVLAVAKTSPSSSSSGSKLPKVKEPESYDGARDDQLLENFFWDVGEYLAGLGGLSDAQEVRAAARYLTGTAKVWWRTLANDIAAGRSTKKVDSWEDLKKALRDQFRPGNAAWLARIKLSQLKQTGKMRDYIKSFQSLMLEIHDMSEADKLFQFTNGLQPWAKVELRRHDVSEVSEAIVVADRLLDFREETSSKNTQNPNASKGKSVDKGQSKSSVKPQGGNKGGKTTQESSEGSQKSSNNSKKVARSHKEENRVERLSRRNVGHVVKLTTTEIVRSDRGCQQFIRRNRMNRMSSTFACSGA
ncbi:hypothetical protein KI387_041270 [Taxus chinensis]|uniref:Retrotransposon gag domain-containing protein n=1 Tax=Taxus chinensis TaxID=29808 RepID=A0AA38C2I3_TAXCH|nr:hypothetical protein KI387_041270 [Taxus chinensis]